MAGLVSLDQLKRAVPARAVDADRPDLHTVVAGVADDLGDRVEPHRLAVDQGRAERVGVMAFHIAGGIGDERKARSVAFRKSVGAKTFELRKGLFSKLRRISILDHAGDQLVLELRDAAGELERGHRFAKLIGLAAGKAGADHRHLHGRLLEERHAERLSKHRFQFGRRIDDRFLAFAAAQIGVHHVALYWSRPDDRHLDDEVVEGPWLQPRQHRHLGPAFDLEGAERVGLADHCIGRKVFLFDVRQVDRFALMLLYQLECFCHAGQHPQRQDIDLHEFQGFDIILVPFDHLPVGHRCRLDGNEIVEPIMR